MKTIHLKSFLTSANSLLDAPTPFRLEEKPHTRFHLNKISVLNLGKVQYSHPEVTGVGEYHAKLKFGKRIFSLEYYNSDGDVIGGTWPKFNDSEFFTLSKKSEYEEQYTLVRTVGSITEKYGVAFNHLTSVIQVNYVKSLNEGLTWTIVYWGSGHY